MSTFFILHHVCVNSSDSNFSTVEKTGGEKTHKLTTNEMPAVSFSNAAWGNTFTCNQGTQLGGVPYAASPNVASKSTGGSQAHNNLQPYITCYMWKRTA